MSFKRHKKNREEGELSDSSDDSDSSESDKDSGQVNSLPFSTKHESFREEGELSDSSEDSNSEKSKLKKQGVDSKKKSIAKSSKHFKNLNIKIHPVSPPKSQKVKDKDKYQIKHVHEKKYDSVARSSSKYSPPFKKRISQSPEQTYHKKRIPSPSRSVRSSEQTRTKNKNYVINSSSLSTLHERDLHPLKQYDSKKDVSKKDTFSQLSAQTYAHSDISPLNSPRLPICHEKDSHPKKKHGSTKDLPEAKKVSSSSIDKIDVDNVLQENQASAVKSIKNGSFLKDKLSKSPVRTHVKKSISVLNSPNLSTIQESNLKQSKRSRAAIDNIDANKVLKKEQVSAIKPFKNISIFKDELSQSPEQTQNNKNISTFSKKDSKPYIRQSSREKDEDEVVSDTNKVLLPSIDPIGVANIIQEKPVYAPTLTENLSLLKENKISQSKDAHDSKNISASTLSCPIKFPKSECLHPSKKSDPEKNPDIAIAKKIISSSFNKTYVDTAHKTISVATFARQVADEQSVSASNSSNVIFPKRENKYVQGKTVSAAKFLKHASCFKEHKLSKSQEFDFEKIDNSAKKSTLSISEKDVSQSSKQLYIKKSISTLNSSSLLKTFKSNYLQPFKQSDLEKDNEIDVQNKLFCLKSCDSSYSSNESSELDLEDLLQHKPLSPNQLMTFPIKHVSNIRHEEDNAETSDDDICNSPPTNRLKISHSNSELPLQNIPSHSSEVSSEGSNSLPTCDNTFSAGENKVFSSSIDEVSDNNVIKKKTVPVVRVIKRVSFKGISALNSSSLVKFPKSGSLLSFQETDSSKHENVAMTTIKVLPSVIDKSDVNNVQEQSTKFTDHASFFKSCKVFRFPKQSHINIDSSSLKSPNLIKLFKGGNFKLLKQSPNEKNEVFAGVSKPLIDAIHSDNAVQEKPISAEFTKQVSFLEKELSQSSEQSFDTDISTSNSHSLPNFPENDYLQPTNLKKYENIAESVPDFTKHASFIKDDEFFLSPKQSHINKNVLSLKSPNLTYVKRAELNSLQQFIPEKGEVVAKVSKPFIDYIHIDNIVQEKATSPIKPPKHVSFLEDKLSTSPEQTLNKDAPVSYSPSLSKFLESNNLQPLKKPDVEKDEDIVEKNVHSPKSPPDNAASPEDDALSLSSDSAVDPKVPDHNKPPPLMQSTNLPSTDGLDFGHDGGGIETSDEDSCDEPTAKRMRISSQSTLKPTQDIPSHDPETSAENTSHPALSDHNYAKREKSEQGLEEMENGEGDDLDLSDSRLMEFDIIDEFESNDNDDDDNQKFSSDEDSDISLSELDTLLEAGIEKKCKHSENSPFFEHEEKQKVILKVRGRDHFDVLPEGWIEVTHNSGMPVYLHKATRVCCVSKPYFLGPGSTRKHEIPVSAIPCLHYLKELEKEKCDNPKSPETAGDGEAFPPAKLESVKETRERGSLSHLAVREYCKKRFEFQTITVKRFKTWSGRRKHQKQEKQRQRPSLPDSTKLITCPLPPAPDKISINGNNSKREFIMNPSGKSPVCILHEYVQHTLRLQPKYVFKELENASTPYGAVVVINDMEYGTGYGSSKKQAKAQAAKAALEVLIPKMRVFSVDRILGEDQQDVEFFDQVRVEDPRVCELSVKAGQPHPYQILLECLKRNYGMGDTEIDFRMRNLKHQKNEFVMTVGRHTAAVVCKNKRDGKHRASQAILQKLHPHITSWGSLLRMYGKGSVKTLKEKKEEEQRITELQAKACANKPNLSILNKLKEEMLKYRKRMKSKKPIGKLIPEMKLTTSDSNLKNVEL